MLLRQMKEPARGEREEFDAKANDKWFARGDKEESIIKANNKSLLQAIKMSMLRGKTI